MPFTRTPEASTLLPALVFGIALTAACQSPVAEDSPGGWPQFRGPAGQGVSNESPLPERWGPEDGSIRWKTRIPGAGNSSPIVTGGLAFVTTTYAEREDNRHKMKYRKWVKRVVLALDLADGRIRWETELYDGPTAKRHWLNTGAAPTPATDGDRVYVLFDSRLTALDLEGRVLWSTDLEPDHFEHSHYGVASSPVLTERAVIVQQDKEEAESGDSGWIAALDKKTGETLWRNEWKDTCCSYTTPIFYRNGRRRELLSTLSGRVVSYDPETGEEHWSVEHPNIQTVPSMVAGDSRFLVPGAIHSRALAVFRLADGAARPEPVWTSPRGASEIASPVLYSGKLIGLAEGGVLTALDPKTGEIEWRERLPSGNYHASLVAGDGKVYALNLEGLTCVVDVERKRDRVISESWIPTESAGSPAIVDGCLLIRGEQDLFRICRPPEGEGGRAG